jgi:hypothetical protein
MTEELELKLVEKYPKILRDHGGHPMHTCMHWGMEHGDGWYRLLDEGMARIQYFCDLCPSGVQLVADQIKEKFGTLRFYYSVTGATEIEYQILEDLINGMEGQSTRTCEVSGDHGYMCRRGGWLRTLSYKEARKSGYEASDEGQESYWKDLDEKTKSEQVSSAS